VKMGENNWALLMFNLGQALKTLGARRGDEVLMREAVRVFRSVLKVRTKASDKLAWARTQRQLGQTLIALGERHVDRDILLEAVATFDEALGAVLRNASPLEWARCKARYRTCKAGRA